MTTFAGGTAKKFQSTQPEWAATVAELKVRKYAVISIHAARVGCDRENHYYPDGNKHFNPRSPSGLRQ